MLARPDADLRIVADGIRDVEQLRLALRARAEQLNISRDAIDALAGLSPGHASKILAPKALKHIGVLTLPLLLTSLGLTIALCEDTEALERMKARLEPRQTRAVRVGACLWSGKAGITRSKRWIKRIAREGGLARARALTPKQRSKQARAAAVIRWKTIKETVRAAALPKPRRSKPVDAQT